MQTLIKYSLVLALLFSCSALFAQNGDWVEESDIEDAKLVIEKQKVLTLPRASRPFGKMDKRGKPDEGSQTSQKYELKLLNFPLGDSEPSIRVIDDKPRPLPMLYNGYVKAGFGNYLSPYLAAHWGSGRSERHAYGASLRHLSAANGPVDKDFSGSGQTELQLYGQLTGRTSTLDGQLGYLRRSAHYYGYDIAPTEKDSIKQVFNDFSFATSWELHQRKGSPLGVNVGLKGNLFSDNYTAKEINADLTLAGTMEMGKSSFVGVELQPILNLRYWADTLQTNRTLAKATVTWNYKTDKLSVAIGGRVAYDFDTTTTASQITAYPVLDLRYDLSPNKASLYLKATGDLKQQTLQQLTQQNPFLNTNTGLRNTHQIVDAALGLRIAATSRVGILLEGGYDLSKNRALMINGFVDPSQFEMAYDGGTTGALHVKGGVSVNVGRVEAVYSGTYWNYSMDQVAEAYHLPTLSNELSIAYRHPEKLTIKLNAFQWSGLKALDGTTLVDLDAIIDVNLRGEYQITENFGAFLSIKNIASQKYQRYYKYPVRGINVLVGGSYVF